MLRLFQDMLSSLKSQVEVMNTSFKRMSTQSEQHGCVQQVCVILSYLVCYAVTLDQDPLTTEESRTPILSLCHCIFREEPFWALFFLKVSDRPSDHSFLRAYIRELKHARF